MATVTTSIGAGTSHSETVTISSVSGSGPYTVTLSATVPASVVIGDALYDEAATPDKWLITGISGSDLTVVDSTGVGAAPDDTSGSSTPVIERYYNGSTPITDWESELDDTNLYTASDDAVGECYNDAAFDETVTINGGGTVSLTSRTLTVASGERHDGTAGTGARVVRTGNGTVISSAIHPTTIEWLEINCNGNGTQGISTSGSGTQDDLRYLIIHDISINNTHLYGVFQNQVKVLMYDSIIYDLLNTSTSFHSCVGFNAGDEIRGAEAYNITVYNVVNNGGNGISHALGGEASSGVTFQNCLGMDTGGTTSGSTNDFNGGSSSTNKNNMSSDDSADDEGGSDHLIGSSHGQTSGDVFVSTTGGSEDLHLVKDAAAVGAGTDLGTTPSNVQYDIDNRNRDAAGDTWDIGADQLVIQTLSIGQGTGHDQNVTITASSVREAPFYDVTLSAAGTNVVDGDALWDEHATPRKYLIISGGGTTSLIVQDTEGTGSAPDNSASSTPQIKRYYNGTTPLTDWEADLDDTDIYSQHDHATGECYNDAAFDETFIINGGPTIGLSSILLTVPSGERHDGTDGTGARVSYSSVPGSFSVLSLSNIVLERTVEWLELTATGSHADPVRCLAFDHDNGNCTARYLICHNLTSSESTTGILQNALGPTFIYDCIVYDIHCTAASFWTCYGIDENSNTAASRLYNNTVYNVDNDGTGTADGIKCRDLSGREARNNIVVGTVGAGSPVDFNPASPANITMSHNLSSDTTASGTGSLTNKTSANQFISITGGSEDLHLKSGADAIDKGTDLGTTPTGVEIDINGRDRDAQGDTWDMGAHEFVLTSILVHLVKFYLQKDISHLLTRGKYI